MADPRRPAAPAPEVPGKYAADDGSVWTLTPENDDGAKPEIDCGSDVWLTNEPRPRWFHRCGVLGEDGHRRAWVFFACGLAPAHTVTRNAAGLITIRASILCGRCGMHGWITDSRWTSA